jgi:hypothetical protein
MASQVSARETAFEELALLLTRSGGFAYSVHTHVPWRVIFPLQMSTIFRICAIAPRASEGVCVARNARVHRGAKEAAWLISRSSQP